MFPFSLCLLPLILPYSLAISCPLPSEISSDCTPHQEDSKCYYICKNQISYEEGKRLCDSAGLSVTSVANQKENEAIKGFLSSSSLADAFIGLTNSGANWQWDDGSTTTFSLLPGSTTPLPVATTTKAATTTKGSASTRPPTSVSILIDASIYSTRSNTNNMISFSSQLASYISDRGQAEFGVTSFGCNSASCSSLSPSSQFESTLSSLNSTIRNECTRTQPTTFADGSGNTVWCYYSPGASMRPRYPHRAVIMFSSVTDTKSINAAQSITPLANSVVITIAVGSKAASLSRLSYPPSNAKRINDFSEMEQLVTMVDGLIFDTNDDSEMDRMSLATSPSECAVLVRDSDEWEVRSCTQSGNIVCAGPSESPIPTPNPTGSDLNTCDDNSAYFVDLNNDLCYQVSVGAETFSPTDGCKGFDVSKKQWQPTPVMSSREMFKIWDLVNSVDGQGMFWIGLWRASPADSWHWANGDAFDPATSYANWRNGYPRDSDDANCVAYVINDNRWINIDCQRELHVVCTHPAI